jgi:hypothetical protein
LTRHNELADKGIDEEKPVMHKISTPRFYAAWTPIGMGRRRVPPPDAHRVLGRTR